MRPFIPPLLANRHSTAAQCVNVNPAPLLRKLLEEGNFLSEFEVSPSILPEMRLGLIAFNFKREISPKGGRAGGRLLLIESLIVNHVRRRRRPNDSFRSIAIIIMLSSRICTYETNERTVGISEKRERGRERDRGQNW